MGTDKEQIYAIIARHLTEDLTQEESSKLESWLSENRKHQIEFDDIVELWHKSQRLQSPRNIGTDHALAEVHEKAGIKRIRNFNLKVIQQVAAILLLSVLLSGLYTYFFSGTTKTYKSDYYQEVSAAYGTRTNLQLPDGTTVILNSGSSLRFSGLFAENATRKVELKGEGFFQVAKDRKRPFIVHVGKLDVKVLGTTFNVNAYDGTDPEIDIALVEGKVSIGKAGSSLSDNLMVLALGQLAHYDIAENEITKETNINPEKYMGWTEGKMIFIDDPIQEVVRRMENWYNIDITIADQHLLNYRFTGTFVNESLEEILNVFSLTSPLNYKIMPAVKDKNGLYSKRTVILKNK